MPRPPGLDVAKIEAALKRAAYKAMHGSREERSGRFLLKNERYGEDVGEVRPDAGGLYLDADKVNASNSAL